MHRFSIEKDVLRPSLMAAFISATLTAHAAERIDLDHVLAMNKAASLTTSLLICEISIDHVGTVSASLSQG